MRGHVVTPDWVVDLMVDKLFRDREPSEGDRLLDPGCGTGVFVRGVLRWCELREAGPPEIVAVDSDPELLEQARQALEDAHVEFLEGDFLREDFGTFDYVISNPPYVSITNLSEDEKDFYRNTYRAAQGRFDLYLLFWEQALGHLRPDGRLVFVTPEKYQYVQTAAALRELLASRHVEELHFLEEGVFPNLTTYPVITVIAAAADGTHPPTRIVHRDQTPDKSPLPADGRSWASAIRGNGPTEHQGPTLEDICVRVSCGVATGADGVFVVPWEELPSALEDHVRPTVSGRQLTHWNGGDGHRPTSAMLVPYDDRGRLLPEDALGPMRDFLGMSHHRKKLEGRSCVTGGGKPWYAFHDNFAAPEILRPKILCKDIAPEVTFWLDPDGELVPRHSVYYIVPKDPELVEPLSEYLMSDDAARWIEGHVQHAANGFLRLQSTVLKRLPVPEELVGEPIQAKLP